MSEEFDIFADLSNVFKEFNIQPSIRKSRIAPSLLYDMDYNIMLVTSAFYINSIHTDAGSLSINSAWLKLLVFVAARPALVPDIKEWISSRKDNSLESMMKMPRAYLGDNTQDATIDFLVARENLKLAGNKIESGPRFAESLSLVEKIEEMNLLGVERSIFYEFNGIRVTQTMLEAK